MREYTIDYSRMEPYEAGAAVVSLLAWPDASATDETLGAVHSSLCAWYLRDRAVHEPAWMTSRLSAKRLYVLREREVMLHDLRQLPRRLRDRMVAARMAIGFMQEVELGRIPKLPPGVKRLTLNEMAQLVLDDAHQSEPQNVETRIWRPSIPVLHLATATATTMEQLEGQGQGCFTFMDMIANPALLQFIVERAALHAEIIIKSRLPINAECLIRVQCISSEAPQ
jgi:hypothetical protein